MTNAQEDRELVRFLRPMARPGVRSIELTAFERVSPQFKVAETAGYITWYPAVWGNHIEYGITDKGREHLEQLEHDLAEYEKSQK